MKKGLFWCKEAESDEPQLIIVAACCDAQGNADTSVVYSSKSGANFNHRREWQKLPKSKTGGQAFNYYPRGRVEVKKSKATVFLNPDLYKAAVCKKIIAEFGLDELYEQGEIVFKPDGSKHYRYTDK